MDVYLRTVMHCMGFFCCGRSTFSVDGKDCKVNKDVERVLKDFHKSGKPIGYVTYLNTLFQGALHSSQFGQRLISGDSLR